MQDRRKKIIHQCSHCQHYNSTHIYFLDKYTPSRCTCSFFCSHCPHDIPMWLCHNSHSCNSIVPYFPCKNSLYSWYILGENPE